MSESRSPLLGSAYLESLPSTPQGVADLEPSVCFNLSRFKQIIRQYRNLDDQVMLRFNRQHALNKQRGEHYAQTDDKECASIWAGLVDNWTGRERIIRFCAEASDAESKIAASPIIGDAAAQAQIDDQPFARQTLRNQLHNELAVEDIVRRRTMNEFLYRCAGFVPPKESLPPKDLAYLPRPTRERML